LDVVSELVRRPDREFPHRLFLTLLADSFGEAVGWNSFGPGDRYVFELHGAPPGFPDPELLEAWVRNVHHHPLFRWHVLTRDYSAMTLGRVPRHVVTPQSRALVSEYLEPYGLEEQLAIPCSSTPGTVAAFVLARAGEDFSEEDFVLAQRLQSLLALLARQVDVLDTAGTDPDCEVGLTGRELAILTLLDRGLTAAAIGHRLAISPRTVHTHLGNIYRKLGVADRLLACHAAREAGLLCGTEQAAVRSG
jgi:DNA-binding CsgD family transcriptional regulator